jgi:hypothetical protein
MRCMEIAEQREVPIRTAAYVLALERLGEAAAAVGYPRAVQRQAMMMYIGGPTPSNDGPKA